MGRSHLASGGSGWFYTGLKKKCNCKLKELQDKHGQVQENAHQHESPAGVIIFSHVLCQFNLETTAKEKVN